jgi:UDP-glucose 4-epimerase
MIFNDKTVLVTGGAGFIGSHLIDRCLTEGAKKVICLDNYVAGSPKNVAHLKEDSRLEVIEGDVRDFELIKKLVERSDYIFHEAASKMVAALDNPRVDLDVNITGTFNILEAARQSKNNPRIIHASTGSVLGSSDKPMPEDHPKRPTTLYGISKTAGEQYCLFYAKEFGVRVTALRYFHVFGPRQDFSGDAGVISIFISKVLKGESPIVYSGGSQIRCFTYVTDDVEANMILAQNDNYIGEVYNVASHDRVSVLELANLVIEKYGVGNIHPVMGDMRQGENYNPIPDTSKIEAVGFKANVSFENGLEKTKQWVKRFLEEKGELEKKND